LGNRRRSAGSSAKSDVGSVSRSAISLSFHLSFHEGRRSIGDDEEDGAWAALVGLMGMDGAKVAREGKAAGMGLARPNVLSGVGYSVAL